MKVGWAPTGTEARWIINGLRGPFGFAQGKLLKRRSSTVEDELVVFRAAWKRPTRAYSLDEL
ncbi:MAG: hypothetical protein WBC78_05515 [Candidatus Sulfotelmatobacter sp.]